MSDDTTPFEEGEAAYRSGKSMMDNPYDPAKQKGEYDQWENGYWMAARSDIQD